MKELKRYRYMLSPMQYNMLRVVLQEKTFSLDEAALYLQPTFSSMARRGYLEPRHQADGSTTLVVTSLAKEAMGAYENQNLMRTYESSTLSQFLNQYIKRTTRRQAS